MHKAAATVAAEHGVAMIIVEAEEQDLTIPSAMPNASMQFIAGLLSMTVPDHGAMIVAPAGAI